MKKYYKECKSTKQVNAYLRKIGLSCFEFDEDWTFDTEFDYDGWQNDKETEGVSVCVTTGYEVFVTKYTDKDIERLKKELNL